MIDRLGALPALLRMHLRAGARVALRAGIPFAAAATAAATFVGSGWLRAFAHEAAQGRMGPVLLGLLAFAAGRAIVPRVTDAGGGWLRHLPAAGTAQRRASILAIVMAEAPLWLGAAFLGLVAWSDSPQAARRFLALIPVETLAGATLALYGRIRLEALLLAAAAGLVAALPYPGAIATGWALLWLSDLAGGSLLNERPRHALLRLSGLGWFDLRLALRAVGGSLAGSFALALLPLLAAALFLANNEVGSRIAGGAVRLTTVAAATLLFARLGETLATRRPAWGWRRSLPETALRRASADVGLMLLAVLPVLALAACFDLLAALAAAISLPAIAARAASALRTGRTRKMGAAGDVLLEGGLVAVVIAIVPAVAWVLLLASGPLLLGAAEDERRIKVSQWLELHHREEGDTASWSGA